MSNSENRKLVFSRREAAVQLGLSVRSVDFLIKSGKLHSVRFGSRVCVPADKLAEFARTGSPDRIRN